jgi:protein SCO1/2
MDMAFPTFVLIMTRKKGFYIGFFIFLVLGFYVALSQIIPGFSKKSSPPISYVRPFNFLKEDGSRVTEKNIAGKVFVAEYFFTTCKGICPKMNNNMRMVYDALKDEPDFLILSHTCDPETDSVATMKKYADSMKVDARKWWFLTGRKDSLYNMARISYTIDDPANNLKSIDDDFMHTQFWALVDRNGDVKKVYDGLKSNEVKAMIRDAKRLLQTK